MDNQRALSNFTEESPKTFSGIFPFLSCFVVIAEYVNRGGSCAERGKGYGPGKRKDRNTHNDSILLLLE